MAKSKQRQLLTKASKKFDNLSGHEANLSVEEDSWIIVKKQRVNIIIPPMPHNVISPEPSPGPNHDQEQAVLDMTTNEPRQCPHETHAQFHSVDDRVMFNSSAPKKRTATAIIVTPQPFSNFAKPVSFGRRMEPENRNQGSRFCNSKIGLCSASKVSKRPLGFLDRGLLLKQRMRASNLERKLHRAGGLSSWLASIGLDQFVEMFRGRSVNNFQLVNLTMEKLKDMGANAVGPRRKLMHAIDCLCQPYCFGAA